jgi:capsule polysaccharide export protein KpsE/RkpR
MENPKVSILDILLILSKNKKFIIIFTFLMSALAVVYVLVVEEQWQSEVTVHPKVDRATISMANNLLDGFGLGQSTTVATLNLKYAAILKSRTVTENTIRKFNLIDYFNIIITDGDTLSAMSQAERLFHSKMMKVTINSEVQFLTIGITSNDKYFSRRIAQHYLDFLLDYIQNIAHNTGRQKRELIEYRINQILDYMNILTAEIGDYQKKHNVIEIEQQAKLALESYARILNAYLENELELIHTETNMANTIHHQHILDNRNMLLETLRKLQSDNTDMPFLIPLNAISDRFLTIQDKVFALELQQKILEALYPQLELARLEELDNAERLEIIDLPSLPGLRAFPKRAMTCIVTFMLSFLASSLFIVLYRLSSADDKSKVKELWKNLFR